MWPDWVCVGAGHYYFGRSNGLNRSTSPGASRKGQFCAVTKTKALYTKSFLQGMVTVNSICNGEGKSGKTLYAV